MGKTREVERDGRDYDTTQLRGGHHGKILHRDYTAHFFRWSFARRFIKKTDNVLEVGCGVDKPLSRILTANAAPYVNTYVGVDLNKVKPSEHQRLAFHGEFNFVERYKELMKKLPDGKPVGKGYDVVVHLEVIEHMRVENGRKLLRACREVLRPGGTMLMSTPCYDGKRHAANHIHEYTVPELEREVVKAGFKVVDRFGTFMDLRHIGKATTGNAKLDEAVRHVRNELERYFDKDAISNFFGPLYPDHARNNLWVCTK